MVEPTFHKMDNVSRPTDWNLGQVHLKEVALRQNREIENLQSFINAQPLIYCNLMYGMIHMKRMVRE